MFDHELNKVKIKTMTEALAHGLGTLLGFMIFFLGMFVITGIYYERNFRKRIKQKSEEKEETFKRNSERRKFLMPNSNMELLTIDDIKKYSRYDFNNDYPLAEAYGLHAETIIQQILGKTFTEVKTEHDGNIPDNIRYASLLMASRLFEMDAAGVPLAFQEVPTVLGVVLEPYAKKGIMQRIQMVNMQLKGYYNNPPGELEG